jgi:phosphate transport system permease protein
LASWAVRKLEDRLFVVAVILGSALALAPLAHALAVTLYNGLSTMASAGLGFFVNPPPTPYSASLGGVAPALVGSLLLLTLALPPSALLGLLLAVFTNEFPGSRAAALVEVGARAFTSVPTVILSMVAYSLIVVPTRSYSALAGAFALTAASLPYSYTAFSSALRMVPEMYREAAYSIGMSRWATVWKVIVPIARRGIASGVLMTLARTLGETAALLFAVGALRYVVPLNPLGPVDALPLLIFDYALSPYKLFHEVAWGAAALLLIVSLVLFALSKVVVKGVRL